MLTLLQADIVDREVFAGAVVEHVQRIAALHTATPPGCAGDTDELQGQSFNMEDWNVVVSCSVCENTDASLGPGEQGGYCTT